MLRYHDGVLFRPSIPQTRRPACAPAPNERGRYMPFAGIAKIDNKIGKEKNRAFLFKIVHENDRTHAALPYFIITFATDKAFAANE